MIWRINPKILPGYGDSDAKLKAEKRIDIGVIIACGVMIIYMASIALFYTPMGFLVFRYLGGARERGDLLCAFQGFDCGLTPCALFGFLPYLGLVAGVYATILQTYRPRSDHFDKRQETMPAFGYRYTSGLIQGEPLKWNKNH